MNGLFEAALEVQGFLQERRWPFCLMGGLAVIRWGDPRTTRDVDVALLTGFGNEEEYVEALLERFQPRISDAARFALENRTLLVSAANGTPVDIVLSGIPFEEGAVRRATPFDFLPDCSLITCSAEDLVVFKAFANRERDWTDVEGVLSRQAGRLDWDYILEQLAPLAEIKAAPEIVERLEGLRRDIQG
jgi:hypothetical protein